MAHSKSKCEHCDSDGYRTDFTFFDHINPDSKASQACSQYIKPCKEHRCYFAGQKG